MGSLRVSPEAMMCMLTGGTFQIVQSLQIAQPDGSSFPG
jgi:hypothetical protein